MQDNHNQITNLMKWIAPILVYLTIGAGLFIFHNAWITLLGFHAAIIVSLLIARPKILIVVLFKSRNIGWIVLNILLCGSSGVVLYYFRSCFGIVADLPTQTTSLGLNASTWPRFMLYFVLVNPLLEEYFWRGYLGDKTKSLHSSDFVYAGYHALILISQTSVFTVVFAVITLTLTGWFWRQIARRDNGDLLAPVLGHMAADCTILMAVYKMVA